MKCAKFGLSRSEIEGVTDYVNPTYYPDAARMRQITAVVSVSRPDRSGRLKGQILLLQRQTRCDVTEDIIDECCERADEADDQCLWALSPQEYAKAIELPHLIHADVIEFSVPPRSSLARYTPGTPEHYVQRPTRQ